MCPRLLRRGGASRAVCRPAATASFNPLTRASISLAFTYALWVRPASPSSRASATSSSTAADSAKTGNAASSTMRSGLTGSNALISKAVPPPISASRKRSIGKPACEERKVIMMISAEMAASFTPRSPPPRNTAKPIASSTTAPACTAPTPTTDTSKSAIATPNATARVSSTARRTRSPTASPSAMTAAIGANVGLSIPRIRIAKNHATQAASAVWMICNHPDRTRTQPARKRTRAEATALPCLDVPSRVSVLRSFSSLPGDARPAEPEFLLFQPNLPALLALLLAPSPPAQLCSVPIARLPPSDLFRALALPDAPLRLSPFAEGGADPVQVLQDLAVRLKNARLVVGEIELPAEAFDDRLCLIELVAG